MELLERHPEKLRIQFLSVNPSGTELQNSLSGEGKSTQIFEGGFFSCSLPSGCSFTLLTIISWLSGLKKCKLILLLGLGEDKDCDFCIPALFEMAVAKNVNKLKRMSEWKRINCMVKAGTALLQDRFGIPY